ncbi:MAG: hypothetical protein HYV07_25810 [Deltaproteobacteria bacterium]|nr:hypothetical protein [Deltaproteobacteria bacterium]
MSASEPLIVVAEIASVLDSLGVVYVIAGSVASSLHGIPRATQDVDLVAALRYPHVKPFAAALEGRFYVDEDSVRSAVLRRSSFNVIHLETMFKADIFVSSDDPWIESELSRFRPESIDLSDRSAVVRFASAEDVLLHKLVWFRLGNEVSERQWKDIVGVLKIQGDRIDQEYLRRWAPHLRVADLLERALSSGTQ